LYNSRLYIWVDAICIDQQNNAEKSSQLLRIKEVYRCARQTTVWLGDELPESTALCVSFLSRNIRVDEDGFLVDMLEANTNLLRTINVPEYEPTWRAMRDDLFLSPWWNRMWVIQEVAVAQRVFMLRGKHAFSWALLERAALAAQVFQCHAFFSNTPEEKARRGPYLPNARAKANYRWRLSMPLDAPGVKLSALELPILELMVNNISCEASDHRDMIYSLLGLATDLRSSPVASDDLTFACRYDRPTEEVYTDFVKVHIRTHNCLDILSFSKNDPPKRHQSLASWVPDWSNLRDSSTHELVPLRPNADDLDRYVYHASGDTQPVFDFLPGNMLRVSGVRVDTVIKCGDAIVDPDDDDAFMQIYFSWMALVLGGSQAEDAQERYVSGEGTKWAAFHRTITADHNLEGRRVSATERFDYVFSPFRSSVDDEESRTLRNKAYRTVNLRCRRRSFVVSTTGYFALAPQDVRVGDVIFVLLGCNVPLILRLVGESWILVGDAFVMGIMDGEIIVRLEDQSKHSKAEGRGTKQGLLQVEDILIA
jgi:hypothetical protein